jgi:diguanylate cyclase (GGDEF)-like protein
MFMSFNLLLVDSAVPYREMVARSLRHMDVEVTQAGSGAQAMELLKNSDFEIAVVDNTLSDQTGLELALAMGEEHEDLKIVLVVEPSFEMESTLKFARENGLSRVLRGPMSADTLYQHLDEIRNSSNNVDEVRQVATKRPSNPRGKPAADASVESHLRAIRQLYQDKLPSELAKLEKSLKKVHKNPSSKEAMREAHRIAHTLHGTAGTLGFAEVSLATEEIEDVLNRLMAGTVSFEDAWDSISMAIGLAVTSPERPSLIETFESKVMGLGTVLLVDDDSDMIASIKALAKKNLISIVPASNAAEALEAIKKRKLDGAIIDVNEENQDRLFGLVGKLRSTKEGQNLPIAVMSVENTVVNRVAAAHAGASQFLHKPLNVEELIDTVREFSSSVSGLNSKVLIVDDDHFFTDHIAEILKSEGMEVSTLNEPVSILETLDRDAPDILLLDVNMPKISGFDLCRMLRSSTLWKNLPILFLTAESDPKVRLECFQAGGDDYIEKPVVKEELLARIGVRQERIRMFKERADQDPLTNLPNRRAFLDVFKARLLEARRYGRPLSLCLIDLDKFKNVNDTYGHLAGDRVLVSFGQLLLSRFRTVDIRGRWGGEEFAVVFYGEDANTGKMILNRVLDEFKGISFEGDKGEKFNTSFSCGIATFPNDGDTFDELFRVADSRLYTAKETGRSKIEI